MHRWDLDDLVGLPSGHSGAWKLIFFKGSSPAPRGAPASDPVDQVFICCGDRRLSSFHWPTVSSGSKGGMRWVR